MPYATVLNICNTCAHGSLSKTSADKKLKNKGLLLTTSSHIHFSYDDIKVRKIKHGGKQ